MHRYRATIRWQYSNGEFSAGHYLRKHTWYFDGDLEIPASASPQIVPEPYSEPSAVDPEEAFIASLSSCHMLWFLSLAANRGYTITEYEDKAEGVMEKNEEGKLAITEVILRPLVRFGSTNIPDQRDFNQLQNQAHEKCFIARSVNAKIIIEAQFTAT